MFKEIGSGHPESYYQKAIAILFKNKKWKIKEQAYFPLKAFGVTIGKNYFDFLIEEKADVELKAGTYFSKAHIDQVLRYLKVSNLKLALLISFGSQGVTYKRIINFDAK